MKNDSDNNNNNILIINLDNTNNINQDAQPQNKIDEIYDYLSAIYDYEQCQKILDSEHVIDNAQGYLINLSDYNSFKEKIQYEFLVKNVANEDLCKEVINEYIDSYKIELEQIKKVEIIDKNNFNFNEDSFMQYKLINKSFAEKICLPEQQNENNIFRYNLDYPILNIELKEGDNMEFLFNDYIVDSNLIITNENSKILFTSKAIIEYFDLNNNFNLKENNEKQKWYLIPKKSTKNLLDFILNSGINFDDENVLYMIIEYINKNKEKEEIMNLLDIEALNFKYKKDFINHIKEEPIAIISPSLYYLIKANSDKKDLSYYCSSLNGIISIYFDKNQEEVKFYPNDNILLYDHRLKIKKKFFNYCWNIFKYFANLFGIKIKNEEKLENDIDIDDKYESKELKLDSDTYELYEPVKDNNNKIEIIEDNNNIINTNDNNIMESEESNNKINIEENNNNIIENNIISENEVNIIEENNEDDEFEVIKGEKKKEIKSLFINCPGIGLQNIGATCYMNATLQCFAHIEKFVNFFKYNSQLTKIKQKPNELKLCTSFKLLIDNLWPENYLNIKDKYYAPYDFKKKISDMNPLFEGIAANDSKDLVNFIIMTLHEELNRVKVNNINNDQNLSIDQTNKNFVLKNFLQEFTSKNQSIISDLFYAMNCSVTECTNCHVKLYNYQIYFFIIFPLEEVRKFKLNNQLNFNNNNIMYNNFINMNNNNNFMLNNKTVNIYDCFDFDKKVNLMSGNNAMYCNYCKLTCDCTMQTYLVAGPEVLILLLNRGKGKEFDVKIDFYEEINLYNYIEYKDTGFKYKLIGVISHIGESGMGGHFIAYCKDPLSNIWNKYNDAIVTKVEDFQNEVINFAMPYLLFYQKSS